MLNPGEHNFLDGLAAKEGVMKSRGFKNEKQVRLPAVTCLASLLAPFGCGMFPLIHLRTTPSLTHTRDLFFFAIPVWACRA